ncbi:UdgX family uracil-DNA binding protein [Paracoccus aminophilus]|uniref:Type-4 uracil-DNA glycosylase n=1 Tax=Paracoccus aminophilus JCM 7686 TaxID=1367847 RepID=S5XU38_PARAH|nr:UdgX family uracil-DNA binding protein [Paracoccus aminophilus]AGT11019.1 uracil DNA glycosylase [Paracoccus aminophilus JCM 7686]
MIRVDLPRFDRFEAWRAAARHLASAEIAPEQILWATEATPPDLFGAAPWPEPGARAVQATPAFLTLARTVSSHSDPEAWGLLYLALMRGQSERGLWANPGDPLMIRLQALAKAVRRDIHKMHAFLRFHELASEGPRRAFAAWFEPAHPILQAATPFFSARFTDMDWLIATPEGVARFDGVLRFEGPSPAPDLPPDASHALWQVYFANIFNPARVKIAAMRSEMPLKYWKNLPETALIPEMLADAPRRLQAMAEAGASTPPAFAAKVTARLRSLEAQDLPASMAEARAQAQSCSRCTLCQHATQTVWGEGDPDAALMVLGEAPGDREDLEGRPFVGPAGQLLRQVMAEVGLDPARLWMTNAVKHFKFTPRGKRRMHQSPNGSEIQHCRWWLDLERRFVAPRLSLALGASAAFGLTGNHAPLAGRRGKIETAEDGGPVLITWHPSFILRLPPAEAQRARAEFAQDLALAQQMLADREARHSTQIS